MIRVGRHRLAATVYGRGTPAVVIEPGFGGCAADWEPIAERLAGMTSAREACEGLLQDALDGGGTDNITIIVGRAVSRDDVSEEPPSRLERDRQT